MLNKLKFYGVITLFVICIVSIVFNVICIIKIKDNNKITESYKQEIENQIKDIQNYRTKILKLTSENEKIIKEYQNKKEKYDIEINKISENKKERDKEANKIFKEK